MKQVKALVLATALVVTLLPLSAVSANVIDEHWSAPKSERANQLGVIFDDRVDFFYVGALTAAIPDSGSTWTSQLCTSLQDSNCLSASYFAFKAMLEPCLTPSSTNCVSRLRGYRADGTFEDAAFQRYVTTDVATYWNGSPELGLPNSRAEGIWQFPTIRHSAGSDFLLTSILDGVYEKSQPLRIYRLQTTLQPTSEVRDESIKRVRAMTVKQDFMSYEQLVRSKAGWTGGMQGMPEKNCAAADDGLCFRREPFPIDFEFEVTVRLSTKVNGWIHGRLSSPKVEILEVAPNQEIRVRGGSIEVPVVAYWDDENSLPESLQTEYRSKAPTTMGITSGGTSKRFQTNGVFNKETIRLFNLWIPYINDRANANPKVWVYGTLGPDTFANSARAFNNGSSCLKSDTGLMGLVTTNATIYDGGMPEFDREEQSLNYQVSAPHLTASGKEFLGSYDLLMRSELARCIYGFTAAPVKATIEVASTDGSNRVATTTLNERDGWLSLGAYGFTYSSPVIKVRLKQEVASTSNPVATEQPTIATNSKSTKKFLTCLKGSKVKKVAAKKCPKGYKKA